MRSFVALMTCIGCIALIHSSDKRILGVKVEKEAPSQMTEQLPVALVFPVAVPAKNHRRSGKPLVTPVVYANRASITARKKVYRSKKDSLTNNFAQIRQTTLLQEIESGELLDNNIP
ncbi:hypothetical protein SAMN05660909_04986 [Chitinophaga terrae (ex Kim and Jung 2007)]|uniref:Uncharacterized protein n=1 Tax=Chitinophaga terrae (ex Kim and Jung 2007) TaxID=408074 RepID=A0A1H4G8A8_9BACT|nr:hypothetical protein SAMN05660909_04986 [Chitinophaga terrae (ex Kim and Jung 2007)]